MMISGSYDKKSEGENMSSIQSKPAASLANHAVLTLSEAAAFLRISKKMLDQMATDQLIPGRKIGEEWRFFKPALEDWLSGKPSSRQQLLEMAGVWKDDPSLDEMLEKIYKGRGRPMVEEDE